jgi:hypothetical protein
MKVDWKEMTLQEKKAGAYRFLLHVVSAMRSCVRLYNVSGSWIAARYSITCRRFLGPAPARVLDLITTKIPADMCALNSILHCLRSPWPPPTLTPG